MAIQENIKVIAFDADDTLWDCQSWFDDVERRCQELLKPWATPREVMGKELLRFPTTPLPEVRETLEQLSQSRRYRLVVFTKGELMDQEDKLRRSGLEEFFSYMETVSNKTETEYRQLCENLGVAPEQTLMVGNSFRSDIVPALNSGAWAIHIPYHVVWALEQSEEYPHDRLIKIARFSEILSHL